MPNKVNLAHYFSEIEPNKEFHRGIKNPALGEEAALIIGGHSRFQAAYRYAGAIATEAVERFNRLLDAPFDLPIISHIYGAAQQGLKRITGKKLILGVKKTGGLRMMGRLSAKYGLGLGAVALGYETADWLTRKSSLTEGTVFDEGLTTGFATLGVKANIAASKIAE